MKRLEKPLNINRTQFFNFAGWLVLIGILAVGTPWADAADDAFVSAWHAGKGARDVERLAPTGDPPRHRLVKVPLACGGNSNVRKSRDRHEI